MVHTFSGLSSSVQACFGDFRCSGAEAYWPRVWKSPKEAACPPNERRLGLGCPKWSRDRGCLWAFPARAGLSTSSGGLEHSASSVRLTSARLVARCLGL